MLLPRLFKLRPDSATLNKNKSLARAISGPIYASATGTSDGTHFVILLAGAIFGVVPLQVGVLLFWGIHEKYFGFNGDAAFFNSLF